MTFKHINFSDSVTMRSLEKVAKEKGLVQPESIEKTAAKKKDYSATDNLTENIIKLCNGLRDLGLSKYADELETNFFNYKKADNLYQTSKEKGEDLVDAAHPHGSHKLEGVEGDSVIETILDQQMKDLEIVNKTPSGKLSKAEAINKVKVVLGQDNDPNQQIAVKSQQFLNILKRMFNVTGRELDDFDPDLFYQSMDKQFLANPTLDNLNKVKSRIDGLKDSMSPGFFGGLSKDTWSKVEGTFSVLNQIIDQMIELRKAANIASYKDIVTEKEKSNVEIGDAIMDNPIITNFDNQVLSALSVVSRYRAQIKTDPELSDNEKNKGIDWLDKKNRLITELKSQFDNLSSQEKINSAPGLLSNLQKLTSNFETFKNQWIG